MSLLDAQHSFSWRLIMWMQLNHWDGLRFGKDSILFKEEEDNMRGVVDDIIFERRVCLDISHSLVV